MNIEKYENFVFFVGINNNVHNDSNVTTEIIVHSSACRKVGFEN